MIADARWWDCSIQEYHDDCPDSISNSELGTFIESPRLFFDQHYSKSYVPERKAVFDFGQVVHDLLLRDRVEIHAGNYASNTVAIFKPGDSPNSEPDYVSKSGSRYWRDENFLTRESDHWGTVSTNDWRLEGDGLCDGSVRCGFVKWSEILHNNCFTPIPREVLSKAGRKQGKKWELFELQNEGGPPMMREKDYIGVMRMLATIRRHKYANKLIEQTEHFERGIKWKDEETGIILRCRPDSYSTKILMDLKTFGKRLLNDEAFAKHAVEYGYHRQAAMYQDGIYKLTGKTVPFVFVVTQKSPPYGCEVYQMSQEFIQKGRDEYRYHIGRLKEHMDAFNWDTPTFGKVVKLHPPKYL